MPDLTKSQKIVFAVLAVAVFYAAYEFFLAPPKAKMDKTAGEAAESAEVKELLNIMLTRITQTAAPAFYYDSIEKAESRWQRDPFIEQAKYNEWTFSRSNGGPSPKPAFTYTGYVDLGSKKVAIINNVEYSVNETLEDEGYILRGIFPSKVVIEDKAKQHRFELFLQE